MILFTIATIAVSSIVQHQITKKRIESNTKLRELREEYTRKRQEHQHELAMKLMREGQQLQFQLQQEMVDAQMKQVKTSFVNELQLMVDEMAYKEWPLKVLPWIIQNQSLGNLLFAGDESGKLPKRDRFAMHCILLPSSCPTFNTHVWLPLESKLEEFCNQYWNSSTGRPVLFYSGSWNRIDPALGSRGIKKPASNDIGMLYDRLNQLPTILIQPDFDLLSKKLKVTVTIWGIPEMEGKHSETYYPDKFQRDFDSKINYRIDTDSAKEAIEDMTPYLESLIGYMADTYFWHASNAAPLLPSLIKEEVVNTDDMPYIRKSAIEFYNDMLKKVEEEASKDEFFSQDISKLFKGVSVLWDDEERKQKLASLYLQHVNLTNNTSYKLVDEMMLAEISSRIPNLKQLTIQEELPDKLTFSVNGVTFNMILVKSGEFTMGYQHEIGDHFTHYSPEHHVKISRNFYIGETLVTQGLYKAITGISVKDIARFYNLSESEIRGEGSDYPMYYLSWDSCQTFAKQLSDITGRIFRIPTEAEWEYAAKGGHKMIKDNYYCGAPKYHLSDYAWYWDNSNHRTHPVKSKLPNELGIYDMSGNVSEWCEDWYEGEDFYKRCCDLGTVEDPINIGKIGDYFKVVRGGSFNDSECYCRVFHRSSGNHMCAYNYSGLRLVLEV